MKKFEERDIVRDDINDYTIKVLGFTEHRRSVKFCYSDKNSDVSFTHMRAIKHHFNGDEYFDDASEIPRRFEAKTREGYKD